MKKLIACCGGTMLLLAWLAGACPAADDPARDEAKQPAAGQPDPHAKEIAELKQSADAFRAAFDQGDAKAVAQCWTKDGDYVDETGQRFVGRDAIEKEYARFFAAHPGAKITIAIDSLRVLSDDAAIEDGRSVVQIGPVAAPGYGRYTAVHTKADGKWRMSTVREARAEAAPSAAELQDLDWLVGSWSTEEQGAKLEMTCRWIGDKNFLERTYAVKRGDKPITSGLQVIGWNGQTQSIQSWLFTSDGGNALGVWSPTKNGWAIDTIGMLADGTPTRAVNVFSRIDDNAFSWKSVQRSAGGVQLPDAAEVVVKREAAKH